MPIFCGRLKISWVGKSVGLRILLVISYIISEPWYNWNTVAMAQSKQTGLVSQPWNAASHLTRPLVKVLVPLLLQFCSLCHSLRYYTASETLIHHNLQPIVTVLELAVNPHPPCSNIGQHLAHTHSRPFTFSLQISSNWHRLELLCWISSSDTASTHHSVVNTKRSLQPK